MLLHRVCVLRVAAAASLGVTLCDTQRAAPSLSSRMRPATAPTPLWRLRNTSSALRGNILLKACAAHSCCRHARHMRTLGMESVPRPPGPGPTAGVGKRAWTRHAPEHRLGFPPPSTRLPPPTTISSMATFPSPTSPPQSRWPFDLGRARACKTVGPGVQLRGCSRAVFCWVGIVWFPRAGVPWSQGWERGVSLSLLGNLQLPELDQSRATARVPLANALCPSPASLRATLPRHVRHCDGIATE